MTREEILDDLVADLVAERYGIPIREWHNTNRVDAVQALELQEADNR